MGYLILHKHELPPGASDVYTNWDEMSSEEQEGILSRLLDYTDSEIATARTASLEAGGKYVFEEKRGQALKAICWVIKNRWEAGQAGVPGSGNWSGSLWEIAMSSEFDAVAENPYYVPTVEELKIARGVLNGGTDDPTSGAVWFHSQELPKGTEECKPILEIENRVGDTLWGLYFYLLDSCPGGPVPGVGCDKCK